MVATLGALGLSATAWAGSHGGSWELPFGTYLYSTAEAPLEYRGPLPNHLLAMNDSTSALPRSERRLDTEVMRTQGPAAASKAKASPAESETSPEKDQGAVPRVASTARSTRPELSRGSAPSGEVSRDPIVLAKQAIAACQARYSTVEDYTCTFHKRERIDGELVQPHVMEMKARTKPHSLYFKFQRPKKGREAIYIAGRHGGKILAHDVGLGKLVAGTMNLDPKGSMAMEENRHPVTEAGLGSLIDTVAKRWAVELTPGESRVTLHHQVRVGNRPCTMIETVHPHKQPTFLFHMVKLYIDHELGLPIRFEAYDWPTRAGRPPELVEEYTYMNLRTNVGLRDHDFDAANPQYSYGRF